MAYCDQRQIDRAYGAYLIGFTRAELGTRTTPTFKAGWDAGYTMGEDHGFGRGWDAAVSYRRQRQTQLRARLRPAYRKLALRRGVRLGILSINQEVSR